MSSFDRKSTVVNEESDDDTRIPREQWIAHILRKHPDVLEFKERIRPLTSQPSASREYTHAKTEVKDILSNHNVTQMILQFLEDNNLVNSKKSLEQESGVQYTPNNLQPKERLVNLLSVGIKNPFESDLFLPNLEAEASNSGDQEVEVNDYVTIFKQENEDNDVKFWDEPPDSPSNILIANAERDQPLIAGTLNKLIEWLTSDRSQDLTFRKVFLLTYPSFASPETVLKKLFERYMVDETKVKEPEAKKNIRVRVVLVIKSWIETNPNDWNEQMCASLRSFIDDLLLPDQNNDLAKSLRNALSKKEAGTKEHSTNSTLNAATFPEPKVPKSIFSPNLILFEVPEEEIARQLTIMDFSIYSGIQPSELLSGNCYKRPHLSYTITAMANRFNEIALWVTTSVLTTASLKNRVRLVIFLIRIAEHLKGLNSFNMLMAIVSGLTCHPVRRLKFTFRELPPVQKKSLQDYIRFFSPDNSYKQYRQTYAEIKTSCIPYLGIHLRDIAIVEEVYPDRCGQMINFRKRRILYNLIVDALRFQATPYALHSIQQITHFFTNIPDLIHDEAELFKLSNTVEPRGATVVE